MSQTLRLFHYASKRIDRLHGTGYAQLRDQMKPVGLWLSVGRAWQRWCEAEDFHLEDLRRLHYVWVRRDGLLILRSERDIDRFTREYLDAAATSEYRSIDWGKVAARYTGIVIAPYCWKRRMAHHTSWYYTWDCASACVWDLSIIDNIQAKP